jgi:hypothetical protein
MCVLGFPHGQHNERHPTKSPNRDMDKPLFLLALLYFGFGCYHFHVRVNPGQRVGGPRPGLAMLNITSASRCICLFRFHWHVNWLTTFAPCDSNVFVCKCGKTWDMLSKRLKVGVFKDKSCHVSHQDWCQLALEVEQPLCERSSGHLDATLVGRVDLKVVAVCAVEAQKARSFPWR